MAKIPLTLKSRDFNIIVKNVPLMKKLRALTLGYGSGMNFELDCIMELAALKKVKAKALLAFHENELVGWAILTKEVSNYYFWRLNGSFDPKLGILFEVFVKDKFRRLGIASDLVTLAKEKAGKHKLCFVPWDERSSSFYNSIKNVEAVYI